MTSSQRRSRHLPLRSAPLSAAALTLTLTIAVTTAAGCGGHDAETAVRDSWAQLGACLVGDPWRESPPEPVLRRAQLLAATDGATGASAWPARCTPHLDALRRALDAAPADQFAALRESTSASLPLWEPGEPGLTPRIDYERVSALLAQGHDMSPHGDMKGVRGPALATPVQSSAAAAIHSEELSTDPAPGADLWLLAPMDACVLHATTPSQIACQSLHQAARPRGNRNAVLVENDDPVAAPMVLVGSPFPGESGLFGAYDGARASAPDDAYAALRLPSGLVTLTLMQGHAMLAGDGTTPSRPHPIVGTDPVPDRGAATAPALVAESLAWIAHGHLFVRHLADELAGTDLGASPVADLPVHPRGCRVGSFIAIDLGGPGLAIRTHGAWHLSRFTGPGMSFDSRLSCDETTANVVMVDARASDPSHVIVREERCDGGDSCVSKTARIDDLGPMHESATPVAVDFGNGRVLLAWRRAAPGGSDAGVRIRIGALEALPRTHDTLVFDPVGHDLSLMRAGVRPVRLEAYARGGQAWLFVHREDEWVALHVAPDGTFGPVSVAARAR